MKILIINGSPRRQGVISQMLDTMREEAALHSDVIIRCVNVIDLEVHPCMGCMQCRKIGRCVTFPSDDSQKILAEMRESDLVVCGAPCYWGNMPGHLKVLFDRMVYGLMRDGSTFPTPLMKGKRCILLSTCTTPWPLNVLFRQSHGTIRALSEIFHCGGFRVARIIEKGGTARHPRLTEREKQRCRSAIRREISRNGSRRVCPDKS